MELKKYYSLDESFSRDIVIERLEDLESEDKISFDIEDNDIIIITDNGLDESELEELLEFFEDNDVFEYLEREDEDDIGFFDSDFLDYDE